MTDPMSLPEDVIAEANAAIARVLLADYSSEYANNFDWMDFSDPAGRVLAAALPVFLEWHEAEMQANDEAHRFVWLVTEQARSANRIDTAVREAANGIADAIEARYPQRDLTNLSYSEGRQDENDVCEQIARTWPDREALNPSPDAPASTERAQEPVSGTPVGPIGIQDNSARSSDVQ